MIWDNYNTDLLIRHFLLIKRFQRINDTTENNLFFSLLFVELLKIKERNFSSRSIKTLRSSTTDGRRNKVKEKLFFSLIYSPTDNKIEKQSSENCWTFLEMNNPSLFEKMISFLSFEQVTQECFFQNDRFKSNFQGLFPFLSHKTHYSSKISNIWVSFRGNLQYSLMILHSDPNGSSSI